MGNGGSTPLSPLATEPAVRDLIFGSGFNERGNCPNEIAFRMTVILP
jgi:hypothetical protein